MHKFKLPYNLQFFAVNEDVTGKNIFELVTSDELASYWEEMASDEEYLGEELFPAQQKLGLKLELIFGADELPVVLNPSAYDVAALKRDRIGIDKAETNMPFFKEGMAIDEELRQQLNTMIETGNPQLVKAVLRRVFDDEMRLLKGARAQRERLRMMLLTTGMISVSANGQNYDYDYHMKESHKKKAAVSWKDPKADIIEDIRGWQDEIEQETGVRPTRAICSSKTFAYFRKNDDFRNAIWGNNASAPVSDAKIKEYLIAELDLKVKPYSKKFKDEAKKTCQFIPDDIFVLIPAGDLGVSWYGTTPEQSDLMSGAAANVSIVDTGVAITTSKKIDPVNVDTKVSMIFLPSFETINEVIIADVGGGE